MKYQLKFRHIIYFLLIAAFVRAVTLYQGQLIEIAQVIRAGKGIYLWAAMAVFLVAVSNQGAIYASIYHLLDLPPERRQLSFLYLITRFVSVAAPSGGLSGIIPFIQDARRRRLAVGTVLIANVLYLVLWYSTFAVFLFVGLMHLFLVHDLEWFEVVEALILLLADLLAGAGLILAWAAPERLTAVLHRLSQILARVTRFFHRPPILTEDRVEIFADDLSRAMASIHQAGWRKLLQPVTYAFLNEILNLVILFLIAYAFGLKLTFGILVATYSVAILFFLITPTPGGLGIVEGVMIVVLSSLGVSNDRAAVVTLAYRGFTFWLPFVLGFVALRLLNRETAVFGPGDGPL